MVVLIWQREEEQKRKEIKYAQRVQLGQKKTFDKYPSAYANLAASKYCKDPNYAKKSKRK